MNSGLTIFFSISSSSSARARRSTSVRGWGWCPCSSLIVVPSRGLEVLLVEVDVHGGVRAGGVGPELGGVEAHAVRGVEDLGAPVGLDLGPRDDGLDTHHDALSPAHVAGAADVTGEVGIADEHHV